MSKWHGGKGSKQRPTDYNKFADNWDNIFKSKPKQDIHDVYNDERLVTNRDKESLFKENPK